MVSSKQKKLAAALALVFVAVWMAWPQSYQGCIENAAKTAQGSDAAFRALSSAKCESKRYEKPFLSELFAHKQNQQTPRLAEFNGQLDTNR